MQEYNAIENDIDRIRLNIYEKTKLMTPSQRAERTKVIGKSAADKYGFIIYNSVEDVKKGIAIYVLAHR